MAARRVAFGVADDTQAALDTLRAALVLPFAELCVDDLSLDVGPGRVTSFVGPGCNQP